MRAPNMTPLTPEQADLVAEHADWARRGAYKQSWRAQGRLSIDDLMSAAYMGLIYAARRFDPARGFKFKTFAMPWCEAFMRREIDQQRRADGYVFDARVAGGMRPVITRIDWPTDPFGQPMELGHADPEVEEALELDQRRALLLSYAVDQDTRTLVARLQEGRSLSQIGRELGVTDRAVQGRMTSLARRVRPRVLTIQRRLREARAMMPRRALTGRS